MFLLLPRLSREILHASSLLEDVVSRSYACGTSTDLPVRSIPTINLSENT